MNNSKHLKDELAVVKFRYKKPKSNRSILIQKIIQYEVKETPSENLMFACAVAEFGMLLRGSNYKGSASFKSIIEKAKKGLGDDVHGYRAEFIRLVERAELLMKSYDDMQ